MRKAEKAEAPVKENAKHGFARVKWGAMLACLCLVTGGAMLLKGRPGPSPSVLHWSEGWNAGDYFMYGNTGSGGTGTGRSLNGSALLYAEERSFSDRREQLEEDGIIPLLDQHPLFLCLVHYNKDGSIFDVDLSWDRIGEMSDHSSLKMTAGHREAGQIRDVAAVETDANGNIVAPGITVTERDGIRIVAEGGENRAKTLTFQNDNGWYQISGSSDDGYEAVVALLDWFWEHPLDFNRFPISEGDRYEHAALAEYPDAFSEYLPDFSAFGFAEEESGLILKNGKPVTFEGSYAAHADEAAVRAGNDRGTDGGGAIRWRLKTEPDLYDVQSCIGELAGLTEQLVAEEVLKESGISFMWDGSCVTVYSDDAAKAWELIESLMPE